MQKKKQLELLQLLTLEIHWLGSDEDRVRRLEALFGEVASVTGESGVRLISRLIERCVYLTSDDYDRRIFSMAERIAQSFDFTTSVICATTGDRSKDSAQKILYDLNSSLATLNHFRVKTLNRYDAAFDSFKKDPALKTIVLVDEFVGTGGTIVNRVSRIQSQFAGAGKSVPLIHFVGLAGMEFGLVEVGKVVQSLHVELLLKKGIEQLSKSTEISGDYLLMDALESNLSAEFDDIELPRRGYGSSEALFARKNGNCPNNVFPVFWWPQLGDLSMRRPFFPRSMRG